MKRSRGVMKVTSRKEWNGNVEHTFERDSFQFAVPPITNEERLVLLIEPETQGCIKPSSISISIGISFCCRSSQSGYLPFDKHDVSIVTSKSTTYTHPHKKKRHIYFTILGNMTCSYLGESSFELNGRRKRIWCRFVDQLLCRRDNLNEHSFQVHPDSLVCHSQHEHSSVLRQ